MAKKKTKEDLLKVRNERKSRKPTFNRDDSHKVGRVSTSWRRPKGHQAKLRLGLRSAGRHVSTGFRSPALVRGLSRNGLEPVLVATPSALNALDANTQGVLVSGKVGVRKRVEIVKAAQEKKLTLLNVKDPAAYVAAALENVKKRGQEASKRQSEREAKHKAAQKASEKEKKDEAKTDAKDAKADAKPAQKDAATPKADKPAAKPEDKKPAAPAKKEEPAKK